MHDEITDSWIGTERGSIFGSSCFSFLDILSDF
jgi:hypothetical protein